METSDLRRLKPAAQDDAGATVHEAVRACAALFRVKGSGLMVTDDRGTLHYIAASDGAARLLEHAQTEAGEGPCVEAFVTDRLVLCDDVSTETRWPAVTPTLVRHGIVAVLSSPLRLGEAPVGTLNVYHDRPHRWSGQEQTALTRYSEVIGSALSTAVAAHRAGELAGQLQYALDYRAVIERAVGYLMAQRGLDAVTAFEVLRRAARDQRRKVSVVARELLDSGLLSP